jgi:hypothetical protein
MRFATWLIADPPAGIGATQRAPRAHRHGSGPRFRDRMKARMRARRLDRALAAGSSPESSAPLKARARALTSPESRLTLAGSLRAIARGRGAERPRSVRVPACRERVSDARDALERLADRLAGADVVDVRGVALARELLADGAGPLYRSDSPDDLRVRAHEALAALGGGTAVRD